MTFQTNETIKRLWSDFLREQLAAIPPGQRQQYEQQFEDRFDDLLKAGANGGSEGFLDLIGFGAKGTMAFEEQSYPYIKQDFDESVVPSQLHAAAELYYIYQHERMKVFQVVRMLAAALPPGPHAHPARSGRQGALPDREVAAAALHRARPDGRLPARLQLRHARRRQRAPCVNRNFHRQFVGFMAPPSQYFRDLLIGEVIRGGQLIEQRPFGRSAPSSASAPTCGRRLDRATYGNIFALTVEVGALPQDGARRAGDARHQEGVRRQHQVGRDRDRLRALPRRHRRAEPQRAKMAESGRRILQFIADNDFKTALDPILFQSEVRPMGNHAARLGSRPTG